ncbi:MAG: S8/S53 family peptidase [Dehalococcoidia bacterium]
MVGDVIGEECFESCPNNSDRQSGVGSTVHSPFDLDLPLRNGHGSFVSGVITSAGAVAALGIAPSAGIFAYKAAGSAGFDIDAVFGALDHILSVTLQRYSVGLPPLTPIINMSFGGGSYPAGTCATDQPLVDATLGYLRLFGVLPIASSGNDAQKSSMKWPACSTPVVSVGATYDADVGYQDYHNSLGNFICEDVTSAVDGAACLSNATTDLDMLGPGALTTAPWPGGGTLTGAGTSAAAPHVAAVAALMKQARPNLTPAQLEERLEETGTWVDDDLNDGNPASTLWKPRIDARVALLTNDAADYDQDGCSNGEEFGTNVELGGQRNPLDFWDFFDTPSPTRNKLVDLNNDIFGVAGRFGANDNGGMAPINRNSNPLTTPAPPVPAYHPAFDRSPAIGPNAWNLGPPDGIIDLFNDILPVAAQFGHTCEAAP